MMELHPMGYRFFNVMSDYRCVFNGMKAARAAIGIENYS